MIWAWHSWHPGSERALGRVISITWEGGLSGQRRDGGGGKPRTSMGDITRARWCREGCWIGESIGYTDDRGMYHRGREQDKEGIVRGKGWEERAWEMAGRGEEDTRDWLFSGGRPVSDVRPGLVPNSTKGSPTSEARTPNTCFHLKSH